MRAKPGTFGALGITSRSPDFFGCIRIAHKPLTSLDGCPDVVLGHFTIYRNKNLTSFIGGPKEVGDSFSVSGCRIASLEGIPREIGSHIRLDEDYLTSLVGINKLTEMNGRIFLDKSPIKSHILGVFFIKGCQGLHTEDTCDFRKAVDIVNKYIHNGRAGLLPCAKELIEAGLADFAQI
jgi:hypothetical protein